MIERNPIHSGWRYELKVVCEGHMLGQARSWLRLHPENFRVTYQPRIVNNLYFDTQNFENLDDNLAGIPDRRKLRLRWYGPPTSLIIKNSTMEIKEKRGYLGDKRRFNLKDTFDLSKPYYLTVPALFSNFEPAWLARIKTMSQPTLINRYRREYFASGDGAVRATLDYEQIVFDQRLSAIPNLARSMPMTDLVIIELKASPELHARLEEVMGHFPMQRTRNSKYVRGMLGSLI